ncbi:MAG: ribonuclease P protein component [Saprospiraceae bacterium]|nr:ribonuclease P protein component [Saprospiraceae bacterium]
MPDQSFNARERLKSRKLIQQLFKEGQNTFAYPLKWVYLPVEFDPDSPPVQFTVSVSKKTFKKAVDRNLLKRRIKEAYRLSKSEYIDRLKNSQKTFAVMAVYVGKTVEDYDTIQKSVLRNWNKMIRELTEKADLNNKD